MIAWFLRLFRQPGPSRREMMAQQNHLDGLEERVEYVYAELKKLRGRVYANERREKSLEDAPGEEIEEAPSPQHTRRTSDIIAGKHWYRGA